MYNALIQDQLDQINKLDKSYANIIIFKGFPNDYILGVAENFPFVADKNTSFKGNKIDIEAVEKNTTNLIRKLLNINSGISILLYEELTAICDQIKLSTFPFKFIIYENNFFTEFPNQSTHEFIDIEQEVEKTNINIKDDKSFNKFYVNSVYKNKVNIIQYRDIDLTENTNLTVLPFFDSKKKVTQLSPREIKVDKVPNDAIFFSSPENSEYYNAKLEVFSESKVKSITIISDLNSIKTYQYELTFLQYIYGKNAIDFNLYIQHNVPKKGREEFLKLLKEKWKNDNFREILFYKNPDISSDREKITQGELVEEIVTQIEKAQTKNEFNDIFITAPTGAGKSLLFQLPAIYIADKYKLVTIVISPLKALMHDQIQHLKAAGIKNAEYINSDISLIQRDKIIEKIKNGEVSILYLSPELFLSYDIRHFIGEERSLGLLVVDEAHLVTTWGRDFRVDYWYLGTYLKRLKKYSNSKFPVLSLTATAVYGGQDDIVFETVKSLNIIPLFHIGNVRRDEITFNFNHFEFTGSHELEKIEQTTKVIMENIDKNIKTIVYFPWKRQIDIVRRSLPENYGVKTGIYYSNIDKTDKQLVHEDFTKGNILVVMATKAFGMGVDISDIQMIYHHAPSGSLADYVQEVGRVARDKNIKGFANVDFNNKDLKFTKILYGLSSVKQYQIKFALQKIYDLYINRGKKTQMMVSAEDFAFIFSDKTRDLESKVKSTLLLIEKDLLEKYRYNLIYVRPKSLFSTVYACIPKTIEKDFLKKYGSYTKQVSTIGFNRRDGLRDAVQSDTGNIYELYLDKLWEKFFYEDSFPSVKKKFFENTLFLDFTENISPRYKLIIKLHQPPQETLDKISYYFSVLDKIFQRKKSFTMLDLQIELRREIKNELMVRRIANLITTLYTSTFDFNNPTNQLTFDTFIHDKRNASGEEVYQITDSAYLSVKHFNIQKFNLMFSDGNNLFEKYIPLLNKTGEFRIKIAYLIESLNLGNYELLGGQLPQIYIRINDAYKLKTVVEDQNYKNLILQDVENRQKRSVKLMEKFFISEMNNNERWNFIEDYFLGKDKEDGEL